MPNFLLPVALAFLMFAVGLRLSFRDFRQIVETPRALAIGLGAQVILLPAIAFLLAAVFALSAEMRLGLLVLAAAPGGITSNFIALLARADVALSTSMTLITSLIAVFTIPVVLWLFHDGSLAGGLPLTMARTALPVFAVSALPLLAAMTVRAARPGLAGRIEPALRKIATLVFAAIVLAVFYQNWPAVAAHSTDAAPAAVMLNVAIIAIAMTIGQVMRLQPQQTLAIAIECGLQNVAMAMFVCTTILGAVEPMVPAMIYAIVMNVTALLLIRAGRQTVPA